VAYRHLSAGSVGAQPVAGARVGFRSGHRDLDADVVIAGRGGGGREAQEVGAAQLDADDRNGVLELVLFAEVELRASSGGREDRERVGAGRGGCGTSEHWDQAEEINVRTEAAALFESGTSER